MICTAAIDLDNVDFEVSGTSPTVIPCSKIIWNSNTWGSGFVENDRFVVPVNGVFNFDMQVRVKNMTDVERVEVALFQVVGEDGVELEEPDYWFVLDDKYRDGKDILHLNASTQFDFRGNEQYDLRIILHPTEGGTPSATVDGSDDFTAWGLSYFGGLF